MIKIEKLQKSLDGKMVLDGVDLEVKKGETLVIIGRSGCGKSVLLKHIVGLMSPDAGRIIVDNSDISKLSAQALNDLRTRIGVLFQGAALFDSITVGENVGFSLIEHKRMRPRDVARIVNEKLEMVGLGGVAAKMPAELSGGMKKRVGLARALATDPDIILYDEPTTGLDPIMADTINDLIVSLKNKLQVTSIAVTHDMTSAYKIADRIAMLYNGKIIFIGTPADVRGTGDSFVHQFITGSAKGPITNGTGKHNFQEAS